MVKPTIEIKGLSEFNQFLNQELPAKVSASVVRGIARKPAQKAVLEARRLQPINKTGQMKSTIGILRVRNQKQTYVEVGYRGRSKGHIFTTPKKQLQYVYRKGRGKIETFMWLFERAGQNIRGEAINDMSKDISGIIARAFKRRWAR